MILVECSAVFQAFSWEMVMQSTLAKIAFGTLTAPVNLV